MTRAATAGDVPRLAGLVVRPMQPSDVGEADRIMRVAFGTYLKAPDPVQVFGDADVVRTRYRTDPGRAFCAELDGQVVGSNFATRWGSFGFFGPLTVHVDLWDRGIAQALMRPVLDLFDRWGVRDAGLFTFPESPKHVGLYNKFGFWPRELTPVLAKQVDAPQAGAGYDTLGTDRAHGSLDQVLDDCRAVADSVHGGLDLTEEILGVAQHRLGDTVLVRDSDRVVGFAVCHHGTDTEAGSGACYVKFAAVTPGTGAGARFARLLGACEAFTADHGQRMVIAGVNTARREAYRTLLDRGYRAQFHGLTMTRADGPAYNRSDSYVLDDLR